MHRLHDPFVTAQDHRWQDCHTGNHSEDDTFYHNYTDIHTQCKCHKTQGNKSCHCRNRAPDYR